MNTNAYKPQNPNYKLSPLTGMNRSHYIELGKYLPDRALTPGNPNSLPLPEDLPDATYEFT